jgi:hypothetical protein
VAVITDFKTGQRRSEHSQQVQYYAVLWWRATGIPCGRVEVRYPDSIDRTPVDSATLAGVEAELAERIDNLRKKLIAVPAEAKLGEHCRLCDVRQFCDSYWERSPGAGKGMTPGVLLDLQVTLLGEPLPMGFQAQTKDQGVVAVVFSEGLYALHGPFRSGERLRILSARMQENNVVELQPWSEVFHG